MTIPPTLSGSSIMKTGIVIAVLVYLGGAWFTAAYTMGNYHECKSSTEALDVSERYWKCGLGDETFFGPMFWPFYWYVRSAKIYGGAA